jgi:hypothetical protein
MISHKTTYLSAAVGALALVATVAAARTVHPQPSTDTRPTTEYTQGTSHTRATTGSGSVDAAPWQIAPLQLHGILGCDATKPGLDCGKVERLLPE